ncbi:MAG: class I SAM-dependent methyltransferase [Acidobacteriota bacterium]
MDRAYREIKCCRVCGHSQLVDILSLGEQYAVAFPDAGDEAAGVAAEDDAPSKAPLDLVLCPTEDGGCGLLQLRHTYDQERLYRRYWYRSGISTTMVAALGDIVRCAVERRPVADGDWVLDIGANDGTLLAAYRRYAPAGVRRFGFEPSNLWRDGLASAEVVVNDYFSSAAWRRELGDARAGIITSIAMFYDLERPNDFVADLRRCLADDGLWVLQMNDLGGMLEHDTFDNISHEHLEYYSLFSLEKLLDRHDFRVVDIEGNDVNGASFRCYIRPAGFPGSADDADGAARVEAWRRRERALGLETRGAYERFAGRIAALRARLRRELEAVRAEGGRVGIYGASTRGLVALQYVGVDRGLVDFAVDKNPEKWGRTIVGTGIPIRSIDAYRADPPAALWVLPYHFKREIVLQEADYLRAGGRMLFMLPHLDVVDAGRLAEFGLGPGAG